MTTRHATASRLALPILASCLVLTACSSTPPEQAEAERICSNLQADNDECRRSFISGYQDQAAALRDGRPFTTAELLAHVPADAAPGVSSGYVAGAKYAETVR